MELVGQIIIAIVTTSLGSILAYFKAIKVSNSKIEAIKINADKEIRKIREESRKELDMIKTQNEEKIKSMLVENELELKKQRRNF